MNKREAKRFAYGTFAGFLDAEIPDIFEMVELDPDVKHSVADLDRIRAAMHEIVDELRNKASRSG